MGYAEDVSPHVPFGWYSVDGASTDLSLLHRRTIAQFGIRDTDRNENHEADQPPTIEETSRSMTGDGGDEKRGIDLPFELADNQLSGSLVELPTFYAGSPIEEMLVGGSEGPSHRYSMTSSASQIPAVSPPPPKSARRQPISYQQNLYIVHPSATTTGGGRDADSAAVPETQFPVGYREGK